MRFAAALLLLLVALPVSAQQFDIPGASSAAIISATPAQPSPADSVRLTLTSPLFDLKSSIISWSVDGAAHSRGAGLTSITVRMGGAGEQTDVSATVQSGEDTALATLTLVPASVDILWEAEGYTPPLYRGRTLPGTGARLTFLAYPSLVQGGKRISDQDLVFTWRKGETVLGSQSGRGKSSLTLTDTLLFGSEVISVDVRTADDALSASGTVTLPNPAIRLRLYQDHPLFGTLFHRALGANAFVNEEEATFRAAPYFAPVRSENDAALVYEWRINRQDVGANQAKPALVTINASGSTGIALLELVLGHASNFFFEARASWQVTFSNAGGSGGVPSPFAPQE